MAPNSASSTGKSSASAALVKRSRRGKPAAAARALLAATLAVTPPQAWAMPQGGTVVSGSATITQAGNQLKVVQTTPKVAINWQSYGIGANELVSYYQPSAQAIALNRVLGGGTSVINGRLTANGQVWISNPSGILFGPSARVNVGGLIATTHDIKVEDFNADRYLFKSDTQPPGIVENQGWITVADAGLAAFVAPGVVNHGVINARLGQVFLASGNEFTVDLYGDQKINLALDAKTALQVLGRDGKPLDALVKNGGKIFADGGTVQITAAAAKGLVDNVISVGGLIEARSVRQVNGEIILGGGGVQVTGTLDASGKGSGQTGGTVAVTGDSVRVKAGARIDVSGSAGGGQALIGGDFRGGNATTAEYEEYALRPAHKPVPPAETTTVDAGAVITADALSSGRGGELIVWSDAATSVHGSLSARGGAQGGDGGFIETSGHWLDVGSIGASTKANRGTSGTWLLDPYSVTIANSGASGTSFSTTFTSGATSTLLAGDITNALLSGSVVIQTGGSSGDGQGNGDITVNYPIIWSSHQLKLTAFNNIYINANLNGSGSASLALEYGQGTGASGSSAYFLNTAAGSAVNLPDGSYFSTKLGAITTNYTVISSLAAIGATGNWALGADIGTSGNTFVFTPISSFSSGTFDGLGHSIYGMTISNPAANNLALFGTIASGGVVRNLGLVGGSVTAGAGAYSIGMLAGENDGTILNVYTTGTVSAGIGAHEVGGLVGSNTGGTISSSYAGGTVGALDNAYDIGGLVGINYGSPMSTISSSYATGDVSGGVGAYTIGGLVGENLGTINSGSYASGNVSGGGGAHQLGGLVGSNSGGISASSYATGNITGAAGAYNLGGLVGINYGTGTIDTTHATGSVTVATGSAAVACGGGSANPAGGLVGCNSGGSIVNSYATGAVSGSIGVGGLVGWNASPGTVSSSYATGAVSGGAGSAYLGGLAGYSASSISTSYATGTVSGGSGTHPIGGLVGENGGGGTVLNSYSTGAVTGGATN